jgi:predicted chitinase
MMDDIARAAPRGVRCCHVADPASIEAMAMTAYQARVDRWISQFEEGYFHPLTNLARLTEEVGEFAREVNHRYGQKTKKHDEPDADLAMESAMWFWQSREINEIADRGVDEITVQRVTKAVNGGLNGLAERYALTVKLYEWLKDEE